MSDPRSVRTNNPGALNWGPFAQQWGATGSDGRLAIFPDQDTGFRAMGGLLDLYDRKHGLNTVSGIINRWAPRNVDNNSTDAYISTVARQVGVDPNATLGPEHRQALLTAMASYEAGRPVAPGSVSAPSPAPAGQRTPMADEQPRRPRGLLDGLVDGFSNPLTQGGLSLLLSGIEGKGFAPALQGGVQTGILAQRSRAEQARQGRMDDLLRQMQTSPAFADVPPALVQAAVASGDPGLVAKFVASHPERQLERDKLQLGVDKLREDTEHNRAMRPIQQMTAQAQLDAARRKEPEQMFFEQLYRNMGQQGQTQGPAIGQTPQVIPQSFEGGGDPNIIKTQVAQPGAATPQDTIQTPLGPMTKQNSDMLRFGLAKDKGDVIKDWQERDKLGKEATNENQKGAIKDLETLQQVRNIRASLDPKFLEIPVRAGMEWKSIKDKFGKLTPEGQKDLYAFATFRRDSAEMFNTAVKNNSGATVTAQEMQRNSVQYANAGSGIFDGDSPTDFVAKIDRGEEVIMLGLARRRYLNDQGFKGTLDQAANIMPIERMRDVIKNRAAQIGNELLAQNPKANPVELRGAIKQKLSQEFGI